MIRIGLKILKKANENGFGEKLYLILKNDRFKKNSISKILNFNS